MSRHAPHAPGPRPGTWWKLGRRPLYDTLAAPVSVIDGVKVTPPIYTKPDPKRAKKNKKR